MTNKLIYAGIFVLAFLLVTGVMIYLNSSYKNIFAMDFTPLVSEKPQSSAQGVSQAAGSNDSLHYILASLIDSIKSGNKRQDTIRVETIKDTMLLDSIKILEGKIKELSLKKDEKKEIKNPKDVKQVKQVNTDSIKQKEAELAAQVQPKDSIYKSWIKKTSTLYESMDSRKAAKIIQTYSDNIAKDIIYSMKKKKAAEILSELTPELVTRITRSR